MTNEQTIEYKDARIRAALATLVDLDEKTVEEQIVCLDAVNTHLVEALYGKPEPKRVTLIEFLNHPTSSERLAASLAACSNTPDSQAIEQARAVLRGTMNPTILPTDLIKIGIITDRHGICVTINKDAFRLFTSRRVMPDRLIEALEDAAQFAEHGMPYDDGGSALMSIRDWITRLSVVSDLRRILGVTV